MNNLGKSMWSLDFRFEILKEINVRNKEKGDRIIALDGRTQVKIWHLGQDSSFSQFKSTCYLPTRVMRSFSELFSSETDKNYTQEFKASVNDPKG